LSSDEEGLLNRTNVQLGPDDRARNGNKFHEAKKILDNILPWDLYNPYETRHPWGYLKEVKDAVTSVVPNRIVKNI